MFGAPSRSGFSYLSHQWVSVASTGPARPAPRSTRCSVSARSPGPSNHIRLGSLRNQINCRRAYRRFSCAISARVAGLVAHAARASPSPAGRPGRRTAARLRARRAPAAPRTSSTQPARRTARRRAAPRARRSAPPACAARSPTTSQSASGDTRVGEVRGQRPAGREVHLERADQPLQVARHECARPTSGSTRAQHAVQTLDAASRRRSRSSRARSASSAPGPGNRPRVSAR